MILDARLRIVGKAPFGGCVYVDCEFNDLFDRADARLAQEILLRIRAARAKLEATR